ncbi:unnamed protein product [Knipowitschia caucasica]
MSLKKRKKYTSDLKCVFFPDELDCGVQKGGKDSALSVTSSVRSWEKCGESFLDTTTKTKPKSSGRTLSAIRKLALDLDPCVAEPHEEPLQIAWSDSDKSEEETKEPKVLKVVPKKRATRSGVVSCQSYTSALNLLTDYNEEPPVIDTDSDIVQSEEEVDGDSGQLISDCDSNGSDEAEDKVAPHSSNPQELEISGYESDEANDRMTVSALGSVEGRQRSVSHWVRSAQAMLQTPTKAAEKPSKTPEDSAKKRRKFQSGGLAERLHRLQCRQKSAISFWRHKSVSDNAITADRPGVLVLEITEVHEECSMRLVRCKRYSPPTEAPHHRQDQPPTEAEERAPLLVLFNKETAAQLNPLPKDVIHIYPPWQSLSVEGINYDIILNTHFSQKVSSSSESPVSSVPGSTAAKSTPYALDKDFGLLELCMTTEENHNKEGDGLNVGDLLTGPCQSLLDAIEALGQAGAVGQTVEVVVQRVYSIPVPDSSSGSVLKHRLKSTGASPAPANQTRHARLFGVIDSLWPPLVPLKYHGSTASMQTKGLVAGPPPSFCYLLSGLESSVEPTEESALYFPPRIQTLKEILLRETKSCRCSFVATVVYHKKQKGNIGQEQMWLALTDPSLQDEERPPMRTVTLCISASCALTSFVLEALKQRICRLSFTDVIREHGLLLCAEQSVIQPSAVQAEPTESSVLGSPGAVKPVRLDELDPALSPCSLCTVSGVVVGVDENTAYSWPACDRCGSDQLEMLPHQRFHCVSCKSTLDKPKTNVQLEVILSQSSLKDCTIKMKLQKKTILSLLNIPELEGGEFPGYDVESVLGKELGPLTAYVRLITRKPSLWIGLEEISL